MGRQTVTQLFHKWIDCSQSLKVSGVNGEEQTEGLEALGSNLRLRVSVFRNSCLDSNCYPFNMN